VQPIAVPLAIRGWGWLGGNGGFAGSGCFFFAEFFHFGESQIFLFAPGEVGRVFHLVVGVEFVPAQAPGFAVLFDLGAPFFVAALGFGLDILQLEGLVRRRLKSGFDGGAGAGGVLGFVFLDLISEEVMVVVGLAVEEVFRARVVESGGVRGANRAQDAERRA
jgi:hypothetical protein